MKDCVFCKIRDGGIPKEFTYHDDDVMVFPDIAPFKPVHVLVVPKKHITELVELDDKELLHKLHKAVKKVIADEGLDTKGYRVSINGGGAQAVDHLHFHIMGPFEKATSF